MEAALLFRFGWTNYLLVDYHIKDVNLCLLKWFVFRIANKQFGRMIRLHYVWHRAMMVSQDHFMKVQICVLDNSSEVLCYYRDESSDLAYFYSKCQLWLITSAKALHHLMHLPRPSTTAQHTGRLSNRALSTFRSEELQYGLQYSERILEGCY